MQQNDSLAGGQVRCSGSSGQIAVFGDAGNDIELFGMKRDRAGEALVGRCLSLTFHCVITSCPCLFHCLSTASFLDLPLRYHGLSLSFSVPLNCLQVPLGLDFRPAIRVAMPWANDRLLLEDANIVAPVGEVLARIAAAQEADPRRLVEVWPGGPPGGSAEGGGGSWAEAAAEWPVWSCAALPDPCGEFVESRWWEARPGAAEERCLVTEGRALLAVDETVILLTLSLHRY